jgi:molybdopterin converting factor small subunit
MRVHIRLHGILRERLPAEARGKVDLELQEGARLADVLIVLGIEAHFRVARNGTVIEDLSELLSDGDQVDVFRPAAGG